MIDLLRTSRRTLAGALVAGAVVYAANFAAGQSPAVAPAALAEGGAVTPVDVDEIVGTPLERALATIRPENIFADLSFIASDEMHGRDTPSPELLIAARYIRARLQRLGFQPGGPLGSYFYEYQLAHSPLAIDRCEATWTATDGTTATLQAGRDYFFASVGDAGDLVTSGDLVFCGYGRRADFPDNARGKWALCVDNGKGRGQRSRTASQAGVAGLITFPAHDYEGESYTERFGGVMSMLERGRVSWPGGREPREIFPSLFMTRERGLALLDAAGRPPGAAEDWMPEQGAELGVNLEERRSLATQGGMATLENVCGFWPGKDPERSKEVVILSAHYDHVGVSGDDIYNGADDNGTGTCGLLALAEALATYGPLDRSVLLIWVSGEEKGLLGSKAWAENPWLPEGCKPVANINIDMIGRNDPTQILYTPTEKLEQYYNDLAQVLERHAASEGFTNLGSADDYYHRSDQASFETLGIPVMFLFADVHEDYHQPSDTVEKIDTDKVARVTRLVLRMLVDIDDEAIER
ncbi:M28 family metallopeptidase [Engelhardtia mirabilis]|uniref:Aminopeptidase S n=1 Tax=Engelhardtia mirabilis TaxID=2528011 RepID=A0A518BJ60_9BACT|nr:Aminopeptidase S [Planctomycetes bacterium Pla133]QDV01322.1 Aminopeptidase S [Planctomycetes bacterium Pla86]